MTPEIVCLNVGQKYGREYEVRLYEMLCRHTTRPWNFRVIREGPYIGWWNKLLLFPPRTRTIFLDLDTLIVGNVDFLFDYEGPLCMLQDFYDRERKASAVLSIAPGFGGEILRAFEVIGPEKAMEGYWGDQLWIERHAWVNEIDTWQARFPGKIGSYKADQLEDGPKDFALICYHGTPKNHDMPKGHWARECWEGSYANTR